MDDSSACEWSRGTRTASASMSSSGEMPTFLPSPSSPCEKNAGKASLYSDSADMARITPSRSWPGATGATEAGT